MKMKKSIFISIIFTILILSAYNVSAVAGDRYFIIKDDLNIPVINDHNYSVFANGEYLGDAQLNKPFFYPDNTQITIYAPESFNTNFGATTYETGKVMLYIAMMYLLAGFFVIALIVIVVRKIRNG